MSESIYRIKPGNPIAVLLIFIGIVAVGVVGTFFPDSLEARTGIGRMGKHLAPLMIPVGLSMVA